MPGKKQRIDLLLVERGLAPSRTTAQSLVLAGQVVVGDRRVDKAGALVPIDATIRLKGEAIRYVSRGGLKLKAAIDHFQVPIAGKVCADIGASTGGFTDCLLQEGAIRVHAIDVGYGQLHQKLRSDPRVVSRERVNARHLTVAELPEEVEVMVIDVSFISLKLILPAAAPRLRIGGHLIALIKPQFEVGRIEVLKKGVVRDPVARRAAIDSVYQAIQDAGFRGLGVIDSPVPGPAGNVEALAAAVHIPPGSHQG